MKILAEIAAVAILAPLIATAQDVARDIARQMGADTTTSISPGLDRHDIHRDTETVERSRQHVPNLLQSAQGSTAKNPSKTQKKNPPRPRNTSRTERNAISQTAAVTAQKANDNTSASSTTTNSTTGSSTGAGGVSTGEDRTKAESQQRAKRRKQLQPTNGAARERSKDTEIRLHAPSLVNPK